MKLGVTLLIICTLCSPVKGQWTTQASGTKARLRGLSVVSGEVAWASGTGGTVARTSDGGKTWHAGVVPGASALDFRDIHGVDANTAYLLSIGGGDLSRIFKTIDGGATWTTLYVNKDPKGFLDAIAFWDADHGLALGDQVEGRFVIQRTDDAGKTWEPVSPEGMPPALPGEGAFAASGTCLVVQGDGNAWFATGGAKSVHGSSRSTNHGKTWTVHETPVHAGSPSSGIFSLAIVDADHGVAVGGDYKEPGRKDNLVALTSDGGRTWRLPKGDKLGGYRSAVAFVPGTRGQTLVAVGPRVGRLGGRWRELAAAGDNGVSCGRVRKPFLGLGGGRRRPGGEIRGSRIEATLTGSLDDRMNQENGFIRWQTIAGRKDGVRNGKTTNDTRAYSLSMGRGRTVRRVP